MILLELIAGRLPGQELDDKAWRELLMVTDRTLCTPLLRGTPGAPAWFHDEIASRIAKNSLRRAALIETYRDAAHALEQAGVEYVLIKGFTHEVDASLEPSLRAQGDIDLLCQPRDLDAAQDALRKHGFEFHAGAELSDNHGRPLLKPHSWRWQGDYFDPTQPVPVEMHHTIWSAGRDRIPTPGVEEFWDRREWMDAAGFRVPAFCDVDRLGVAALHVLRHVLRNNVRLGHVWELARMLEIREHDTLFWEKWHRLHPAPLRQLESIAFRFAFLWFVKKMPPALSDDWAAMPSRVQEWFSKCAFSPAENLVQPNKDVVWLHLALLPSFVDRWSVARRRLLPLHVPGAIEAAGGSYLGHIGARGRYHALALVRALWTGARSSTTRSKAPHTSD